MKANLKKDYSLMIELLYRLRINAGITQIQLADAINVPQSFISKVETGERKINIIELNEICKVLGSNMIEFVTVLEKELNEAKR